jgi:hypothetical protein
MDDIQFNLKMTELTNMVIDIRDGISELREENVSLREITLGLEKKIAQSVAFEFDGTKYWRKNEQGEKEGPFCQHCKDGEAKNVRLIKESNEMGVYWTCSICNRSADYKSPPSEGYSWRNNSPWG